MTSPMTLERLGWNRALEEAFQPYAARGLQPGRVGIEHRGAYVVHTSLGEMWAETTGAMLHRATGKADLPCIGDWVAVHVRLREKRATIGAVLPRRTRFSRNVAGFTTDEQVLAANIDVALLVSALDADLNLRRLERYLTMAWASGASPVVVLTKADLCSDSTRAMEDVASVAIGVPIHATSAVTGQGVDELWRYLHGNRTAVLLGSSGVGKSSLINELAGEDRQEVQHLREDGKGRHTTTRRELLVLDRGGIVIDTPGLRELQLWDENEGLDETFAEIATLAGDCRFRDCRHEKEPGCAVVRALEQGLLEPGRYEGYKKLERELHYLRVKQDRRAAVLERRKMRALAKSYRDRDKLVY